MEGGSDDNGPKQHVEHFSRPGKLFFLLFFSYLFY
jgi:hypothetical protein